MLFNSVEFIVFFLVVFCVLLIIKHRKFQHLFLLSASYFFFYFSSNYLILLLIFSTLVDYYIAKIIWQTQKRKNKKILLIISLSANLGLLGFYKYADFAILQFNFLGNYFDLGTLPFLNLLLPIGISFYTFQTISYTVDVYREKLTPSNSLYEFALFVSFFPQLVAGPIVRASEFLPQLREKISSASNSKLRQIIITRNNLRMGVTIICFGFMKKLIIADNLAPLVNDIFHSPISHDSFTIILGTVAFGLQIYGDFSGYSDIAIGTALILGFKIPKNFAAPYFSTSPINFWHRWHISLSTWLRDYLYIPLGGNKKSNGRTYFNLFTVMFLGGLWHGASWNFVIWGIIHGGYLAIQKYFTNKFQSTNKIFNSKIGKVFAVLFTQYLVFFAWIPFRVRETNDMIFSMYKFIVWDFKIQEVSEIISNNVLPVSLILGFIIIHFVIYNKENIVNKIAFVKFRYWILFLSLCAFTILYFIPAKTEEFMYFRF